MVFREHPEIETAIIQNKMQDMLEVISEGKEILEAQAEAAGKETH